MDFILAMGGHLGGIAAFFLMFSFLIIIHEFGHYYAAIKSGVKVEEFGLGFGPRIFGVKRGETDFTFNAIPFGGFVRMLGEESEDKDPRSFGQAKLWKRMVITLAGIFVNWVFAVVVFTILFAKGTAPMMTTEDERMEMFKNGTLSFLVKDKDGVDLPLVDGKNVITSDSEIGKQLVDFYNETSELTDEESMKALPLELDFLKEAKIKPNVQYPLVQAFGQSVNETFRVSKSILAQLKTIPAEIIQNKQLPESLSGPVGIARVTKNVVVPAGFEVFIQFAALLSLSLAVMNLLPIPALDGGRFMFQVIELFTKPFGIKLEKFENILHIAGFLLVISFLVAVSFRDIGDWWKAAHEAEEVVV